MAKVVKYVKKDWCPPDYLWEMANFHPSETGLPLKIYLSTNDGKSKHWCRIKAGRNDMSIRDCVSIKVPLEDQFDQKFIRKIQKLKISQSDINKVVDWIKKNEDIILGYWNNEFSTLALSDKLRERNSW